jgi:hypothetical protein
MVERSMTEGRRIVGAVGFAMLIVGLASQVATLTARRPSWGSTEWEVAYFGEFSATLVIVLMGLAVLSALAVQQRSRWPKVVLAVVLALLGSWAMLGALVVALDMPLVWQAARNAGSPARAAGLKIVTVKAIALCGWYALWLFVASGFMVKSTVTKSR